MVAFGLVRDRNRQAAGACASAAAVSASCLLPACARSLDSLVCAAAQLYEVGWGKKLNYVIAFSADEAIDVTRRYTANMRAVAPRRTLADESALAALIAVVDVGARRAAAQHPVLWAALQLRRALEARRALPCASVFMRVLEHVVVMRNAARRCATWSRCGPLWRRTWAAASLGRWSGVRAGQSLARRGAEPRVAPGAPLRRARLPPPPHGASSTLGRLWSGESWAWRATAQTWPPWHALETSCLASRGVGRWCGGAPRRVLRGMPRRYGVRTVPLGQS